MKIQIRRNVFETNSSTNHTLAIRRCDAPDKINQVITLASTPLNELKKMFYEDVVELHNLTLQQKVDVIFYSALASYEARVFLKQVIQLQDILSRFNVILNIDWNSIKDSIDEYFDYSIFRLVSYRLGKEEDIIQFLFSGEAYYTEYCDECGNTPSERIIKIDDLAYGNKDYIYISERM